MSGRQAIVPVPRARSRRTWLRQAGLPVLHLLLLCVTAHAQDALIATARVDAGDGGGASLTWLRPRANGTLAAGATFVSLDDTRWAFGTLAVTHNLDARTMLNAEVNGGRGDDRDGGFGYLLLRGGATREFLPRRLYGEAEWLQIDIARRQHGIARIGATYLATPRLSLRGSVYEALIGDGDTTLLTLRGDYDFGRVRAIGGLSTGTATPALLQQSGREETRVREIFGGVAVDRWTVILSTLDSGSDERQRLTVAYRFGGAP